ncbi:MAG: thiolase family protein [Firmicutes bacterium]|nr:thiolase family protein [Dethiobacter sp.]MBS3897236.1 thiolase family protein [Dethiobacter sp.]MCL4462453.1 thiolase family protein [Bacillota bacterium]MCL5993665.1 thiolase family protein [Bacillota bacterium]
MKHDVVIVSAARTAIGRFGGSLRTVNSGTLGSIVIKEVIQRAGITADLVDEVILGEVRQSTESSNVSRVAALRAGVPESVPAYTVNRLCASSMQAVACGALQIVFNHADVVITGGVENMSRTPIYLRNARFGEGKPVLVDSNFENGQQPSEIYGDDLGMGATAENVAVRYNVSREDQDAFALESQRRAAAAIADGKFNEEIVTVKVREKKETLILDTDEHPRPDTTIEQLKKLAPAFRKDGSVTAGNTCGRNDGGAAMLLMSAQKAMSLGLKPLVRIVDWSVAGVSPEVMGVGPVSAIKILLERTGLALSNIGLIELNEAFASQALAVIRLTGLDPAIVNVNGGAIALGHPLGATGARIMTTLLFEMMRRKEQFGMATLCVGGGQGMAIILELV